MSYAPEAFFLPADSDGRSEGNTRFCVYHPPLRDGIACQPSALVLYVHPFAEEMNKSRRMAALQSRALAQAGCAVLQIDLLGCGDGSGDFGDATWKAWLDDILQAVQWLRERNPVDATQAAPLWLWGLRAGCLLAADAARQIDAPCNFLFWQPPASGKVLLQQFMRLQWAGDMANSDTASKSDALRQRWARGESVEIAGYIVRAELASGLEASTLLPRSTPTAPTTPNAPTVPSKLVWLELSTRTDATLSPASSKQIAAWASAGFTVQSNVVPGPAFWHTAEIEDAPALIEATLNAMATHDLP